MSKLEGGGLGRVSIPGPWTIYFSWLKSDWNFVSKIELSVEHRLALKISKELIQADQDVLVVFGYIPPPPPRKALCTIEIMTVTAV